MLTVLPDDQNDGPEELNCNWDAVGSGIVAFACCVVDDSRQEQPNSDR